MEFWKPSVKELLSLCQEAYRALVPIMDRAYIKWQNEELEDHWDQISDTLMDQIVIDAINSDETLWSQSSNYELGLSRRSEPLWGRNYIKVVHPAVSNNGVFLRFSNNECSFANIWAIEVDSELNIVAEAIEIPFDEAEFCVKVYCDKLMEKRYSKDGSYREVELESIDTGYIPHYVEVSELKVRV